jgi:hypothetical protein
MSAPTFAGWSGIADFCRRGIGAVGDRRYETLSSRAMWPASHFLAAILKARMPSTAWTAEFSDPVRHDVMGRIRSAPVVHDPLLRELAAAIRAAGFAAPDDDNVYTWCEAVAFALADTLVFTNEKQREVMLAECSIDLRSRVLERSVIMEQPTLPASYYALTDPGLVLDPSHLNIGYFGAFYATRGLEEVLDGLELSAASNEDDVRLHVFTSDPTKLEEGLRDRPAGRMVVARPYVPYLDFLSLTRRFDALLVNDAHTRERHGVNPYLPSKWSDYRGSGTPGWGVVERGSVLSTKPLDDVSELGDSRGAHDVINRMVSDLDPSKDRA